MADKAEHLRLVGKNLFESGRWTAAVGVYGQYIDLLLEDGGATEQLVLGNSNRAQTFLRLQMYADALEDTENTLSLDSRHMKSHVRKAKALFGLKLYKETVSICKRFLRRDDLPAVYRRTVSDLLPQARRKDKQTRLGMFDTNFPNLSCSCACGDPGDVASGFEDFVGPVELQRTPGLERGLFATRDLTPGEIVFVAAPLASVRYPEILDPMDPTLLECPYPTGPLEKDTPSMKFFKPVNSLAPNARQLSDDELQHLTFVAEVDEDTLFDIVRRRQSTRGAVDMTEQVAAIYTLPSLINHSCCPSVTVMREGGGTTNSQASLVFRASRKVERGEQLFSCYQNVFFPLADRVALLGSLQCRCERCALEKLLLEEIPVLRKLEHRCSRVFTLAEESFMLGPEKRAQTRRDCIQIIEAVSELFLLKHQYSDGDSAHGSSAEPETRALCTEFSMDGDVCLLWSSQARRRDDRAHP
ncbi:hypothetical protein R1sor_024642 [Riccia sorocarpa]|uniref:SET domain-containing protein n=1 Tax=Riccia sorocarpa TaxID=122646 RepID=A0ABD3GV56_9MARC